MDKDEQEILSLENSVKEKKVSKEDKDESISIYLGEENLKYLQSITSVEYKKFKSLNLNPTESYFVKGSRKILQKFKAFFIAICAYERYSYSTFMLRDYVEGLAEKEDDLSFLAGAERELLFLYLHGESSGTGNTETWLASITVDKIANRKRKGLVTVILSERSFPIIESSEDVIVINLENTKISKSRSLSEETYRKNKERSYTVINTQSTYTSNKKSKKELKEVKDVHEMIEDSNKNSTIKNSSENTTGKIVIDDTVSY